MTDELIADCEFCGHMRKPVIDPHNGKPLSDKALKWYRLNTKLRITMCIFLIAIGILVYTLGIGPSCNKCTYCREINDGDPETKGIKICRNAYDIIKEDAAKYITNETMLDVKTSFYDGFKELESSMVANLSRVTYE